jgi:hypothetical protein
MSDSILHITSSKWYNKLHCTMKDHGEEQGAVVQAPSATWFSWPAVTSRLLMLVLATGLLCSCGGGGGGGGDAAAPAPAASSPTGTVALSWDVPLSETSAAPLPNLAGYVIYYGTAPGAYSDAVDVGNTTAHTVTGLAPGIYYFTVTAYDVSGNETDFSGEVSRTVQ